MTMNRNTLLIVDDMEVNRAILRNLFAKDFNILEAQNGEQGLMLLNQCCDRIAAVLLDIVMPVKDGYQMMAEMKSSGLLQTVPVIVITSEEAPEDEVRAFDSGATDIILRPFEACTVKRRVQNVIELNEHRQHQEDIIREQAVTLRNSTDALTDVLSSVIEHRSVETGQHVLRIRLFIRALLEDVMRSYPEYDLDERKIEVIARAATLHDIGKIAIPDAILNKPGPLTPEEMEIMKTHPAKGCEILNDLGRMHDKEYLQYAYNICRYHHERWDGSGYPEGLAMNNIPICAQAAGIADVYDALTTDRVYKKAYSPETASNMLLNGQCGIFAPRLLECFKKIREIFARIANEYADGHSPQIHFSKNHDPGINEPSFEINTLEFGQMKYFAMLRYENSTVMEVDMNSGVYHLVYKQNNDFDKLNPVGLFEASYLAFLQEAVHPDDRDLIQPVGYLEEFLKSGVMKKSRKYRVYHCTTGEYIWYEVTILRIYADIPNQHKILVVWRMCDKNAASPRKASNIACPVMDNSLLGIQKCLNDRWFTVIDINDGFTALLGYTRAEMEQVFHNRFTEIIYPEDREKVIREVREQQNKGNTYEIEYRVVTKDGKVLWILDKSQLYTDESGMDYISCMLIDITTEKKEQEKLRLALERHRIILDQSNDVIFELDMASNKLYYSRNWVKKFGYDPITDEINLRIPQSSHILPEDVQVFVHLLNRVSEGAPYVEAELRIANAEGRYIWCRIRATTQFDQDGQPVKAVGVILDIDREKRRTQNLIEKADRDGLTNLLNKEAAYRRIRSMLEDSQSAGAGAMLLIDLDNFKAVNDTYGHMFGDAVLIEAADQLQRQFRSEDIVARIGGDEFQVFINHIPSRDLLIRRAEKLVGVMQTMLQDTQRDVSLSCSVGLACYPHDASNYQDLFNCCDRALYMAKLLGKNQFAFYNEDTSNRVAEAAMQRSSMKRTRIESNESGDYEVAKLGEQAFQILYKTSEMEKTLPFVLKIWGQKLGVSRVSLFEGAGNGRTCSNTFEWCNEGISSQKENFQCIPYEEMDVCRESFDSKGVFYCADTSVLLKEQRRLLIPPDVRSMLQCALYNDGKFAGMVGFHDCSGRMWVQNEIDALILFSELLSTFLFKWREKERASQAKKGCPAEPCRR